MLAYLKRLRSELAALSPRKKAAVGACLALLLGAGIYFRLVSARLEENSGAAPADSAALEVEGTLLRSTLAIYQRQYGAAVVMLQEGLKKHPRHTDLLLQIGKAYRRTKNFDAAEQADLQALQFAPDCVECRNNLAVLWLETGKIDRAIAMLGEVKSLRPTYPEAYFNLGIAYEKAGKIQDAVASYLEYLTRVPANDSRPEPAMARERLRQLQEGI